jgi:hypothetical protein
MSAAKIGAFAYDAPAVWLHGKAFAAIRASSCAFDGN